MQSTHHNVAVRLDAVNPESVVNQLASSAEQFLELADGKRSDEAGDVDDVGGGSSSRGR